MIAMVVTGIPLGTGVVTDGRSVTRTGSGVLEGDLGSSGVFVVGTGSGVVVVGTGSGVVVSSNTYAKTTSLSDTDPIDMFVSLRDLSRFSKLVAATVDATSSGGIVTVVSTTVDVASRRRRSCCSVTEVIRTTAPEMFIARSTPETYSARLTVVNSSTRIKSVALNVTLAATTFVTRPLFGPEVSTGGVGVIHVLELAAPTLVLYEPAGHLVQALAPMVALYVPVGQLVQAIAPTVALYVPVGQLVHVLNLAAPTMAL
jgi:hypothetical protein